MYGSDGSKSSERADYSGGYGCDSECCFKYVYECL